LEPQDLSRKPAFCPLFDRNASDPRFSFLTWPPLSVDHFFNPPFFECCGLSPSPSSKGKTFPHFPTPFCMSPHMVPGNVPVKWLAQRVVCPPFFFITSFAPFPCVARTLHPPSVSAFISPFQSNRNALLSISLPYPQLIAFLESQASPMHCESTPALQTSGRTRALGCDLALIHRNAFFPMFPLGLLESVTHPSVSGLSYFYLALHVKILPFFSWAG